MKDVMRIVRLVLEEAASVSQQRRGARKQLVFFGNAGIGTREEAGPQRAH
ncbi:hypothetical protein HaLaN_07227 [Haematococcus lacustris]|uniref:Uncharacterized protein n=1 Tax=Haematococcus lacustris TaxID=44745 RepID=A0A699YN20_HAELA|nr:hypothetical protein HaLaN_07227 [Haematococcus lacustris]